MKQQKRRDPTTPIRVYLSELIYTFLCNGYNETVQFPEIYH